MVIFPCKVKIFIVFSRIFRHDFSARKQANVQDWPITAHYTNVNKTEQKLFRNLYIIISLSSQSIKWSNSFTRRFSALKCLKWFIIQVRVTRYFIYICITRHMRKWNSWFSKSQNTNDTIILPNNLNKINVHIHFIWLTQHFAQW